MIEHKKNELCSGNPVSAKALASNKGKQGRGKGSFRSFSSPVREMEKKPNDVSRHGENR